MTIPLLMNSTCAGSTMRVRCAVVARVAGSKRGNCSAMSGSANHHSSTVASAATVVRVPSTVASRRSAPAWSPAARWRV
ncbi:MAG: hypothetical protein U0802_10805 [Candidatus Binatia bacterium]